MWTNIVDGVATSSYWNLGRAHYPGLSCPYILPADAPDEPSRFIEWLLDPEYTLFEGCQCAAVSVWVGVSGWVGGVCRGWQSMRRADEEDGIDLEYTMV